MKKVFLSLLFLGPSCLYAGDGVDFEIKLVAITGNITKLPLTFVVGLYLPEQGAARAGFHNEKKVELSQENIDQLNTDHQLPGEDLTTKVKYSVVRPTNPYFQPYPGFESLSPIHEKHKYRINVDGKDADLDTFHIIVRTDAWGASTWSSSDLLYTFKLMVKYSNVQSMPFQLEDDEVIYHFSISRMNFTGIAACPGGTCSNP